MPNREAHISRRDVLQAGAVLLAVGSSGSATAATTIGGNTDWVRGDRKLTTLGQSVIFKIPNEIDITCLNDQGVRDGRLVQWGNRAGLDNTGPTITMYLDESGNVQVRFEYWLRTAIRVAAPARLLFWPYAASTPEQIYPIYTDLQLGNFEPYGCLGGDGPNVRSIGVSTSNSLQFPLRGCFDVVDHCYLSWAGGGSAGDCD
jgi:hypothetical protein